MDDRGRNFVRSPRNSDENLMSLEALPHGWPPMWLLGRCLKGVHAQ